MKILNLLVLMLASCFAKSQTADFTFTSVNNTLCVPATINFTENCTGNPTSFIWNFGNNNFSEQPNPSFTYTQKGIYQVSLTAIYPNTSLVVTKTIEIDSSKHITISTDDSFICKLGAINFTINGSNKIASATWNMGNGQPDIITSGNLLSYNFQQFGNDSVYVVATENSGCIDTASVKVAIQQPPIVATAVPVSGCIPTTIQLSANVTVPAGDSVINYQWNFADGSPNANTVANNILHTYTSTGFFLPILQITTKNGCTNTDTFSQVSFGTPPQDLVAYPIHDTICASDSMQVFYQSKASQEFIINWNDGIRTFVNTGDNLYSHKYDTLGSITIRVLPFDKGCQGNIATFKVFIKGVVALFNFQNECADKMLFNFNNISLGNVSSTLWDFGDGTTVSNSNNPSHQYNTFDSFAVKLDVADNISGCTDSLIQTIYIGNPVLRNIDTTICINDSVTFNLDDPIIDTAAQYAWHLNKKDYGEGDSSYIKIFADSLGKFDNYVLVDNGPGYCIDTVRAANPLLVRGANLMFDFADSICANNFLRITNNSPLVYLADSVKQWQWNFYNTPSLPSNSYQPNPVYYSNAGKDSIVLSATDQFGCADSLTKYVTINPLPFVQLIPTVDTICLGQIRQLVAFHSDQLTWSPANFVSCATCDTTLISPTATTDFVATVVSEFGCVTKDTVVSIVYKPFTISASFTDTAICQKDSVQFNLNSNNLPVTWIPATGLSSSNTTDPFAFPNQTTQYDAIVSDPIGCFSDTLPITVNIKSLPTVNAGPDQELPYNSSFTLTPVYSNNVISYAWIPADSLSCSNCATPSGVADISQTYSVTVKSDSGCIAKDSVTIFVGCRNSNLLMPTAFTPNNDGRNDFYYPLGRGIKTIKNFAIYNRYGQLVFIKQNFAPNINSYGWDGKLNGMDQPTGTYVYFVQFICDIGDALSGKGTFVLIR